MLNRKSFVETPGDSHPSGPGARPSLLPVAGVPTPTAPPVEPSSDLELLTECVGLWGLYHAGILNYDELDRSLVQTEIRYGADVKLCDSCMMRHPVVFDHGHDICASCRNNGCTCGDCVDEGWATYKDRA